MEQGDRTVCSVTCSMCSVQVPSTLRHQLGQGCWAMRSQHDDELLRIYGNGNASRARTPAYRPLLAPLLSRRSADSRQLATAYAGLSRQTSSAGSAAVLFSRSLENGAGGLTAEALRPAAGTGHKSSGPSAEALPADPTSHMSSGPQPLGRSSVSALSRNIRSSSRNQLASDLQRANRLRQSPPQQTQQSQQLQSPLAPFQPQGPQPFSGQPGVVPLPGVHDGESWRHHQLLQQQQQQQQLRPPLQGQRHLGVPAPPARYCHHASPGSSQGCTAQLLSVAVAQGLTISPAPASAATGSLLSQQLKGSRRSSDLGSSAGTSPAHAHGTLGAALGPPQVTARRRCTPSGALRHSVTTRPAVLCISIP